MFVISLFLFVPQCLILLSQVSNTSRFLSTSPLKKGEGGEEAGVISSVYSVVSQRPGLALPPAHEEGAPEREKADQKVRFCVVAEEEVGLVGLVFLLSPSSFASPHQAADGGDREHHENFKRWTVTTVIVWVDCFGPSWGTGWGCSCLGVHHWAGCLLHHSPDLQSSPTSPG